jgi:DNA polymerase III alpha subunit
MYVHLTTHSAFSLQEGLMTPTDLVQAAKACGMSALGLTDHHLLTGTIEFVKACKDAGIQPVIGSEDRALFMGLGQVKELTQRTIGRIIQFAPFISLDDFLSRVDPRMQEAEHLAKIGALDGFGKIPAILKRLQIGGWQRDQMSLFAWSDASEEEWTLQQKVDAQLEILGASLEAHPLELVEEKLTGAISSIDAVEKIGRRVTVAGVRQTSRRSRTAKGDMMLFLTIEDLQGTLDVILFPDVYRVAKSYLDSNSPLLITGVMEMDKERGEPYLRAEKVASIP